MVVLVASDKRIAYLKKGAAELSLAWHQRRGDWDGYVPLHVWFCIRNRGGIGPWGSYSGQLRLSFPLEWMMTGVCGVSVDEETGC